MRIRCVATGRHLCNINIEDYYKNIKKMGIDITVPLEIEFSCPKCKLQELYEIYPTHYIHVKSYKRIIDNKVNK